VEISLCLLTLNEKQGCVVDVPKLPRTCFKEIFCVDGGSTDGTIEYLKEEGIPVYKQPKPGLNAAHFHAFDICKTEAVVFFHPKKTISTEYLKPFKKLFEDGYQLVIGSRMIKGGHNEEDSRFIRIRKWSTLMFAVVSAAMWRRNGNMIWDTTHGFRGITKKAFNKMKISKKGSTIDGETIINAYKLRLPRVEFPTEELPRTYGKTHFSTFSGGLSYLRLLFGEIFFPHIRFKKEEIF